MLDFLKELFASLSESTKIITSWGVRDGSDWPVECLEGGFFLLAREAVDGVGFDVKATSGGKLGWECDEGFVVVEDDDGTVWLLVLVLREEERAVVVDLGSAAVTTPWVGEVDLDDG